jgi:cytochrome c peroxidase
MKKGLVSLVIFGALAASPLVSLAWEALPAKAPAPENNPTTAAKVDLGKHLFFDPRFSATGTVSCASCHNVMGGGEDNRAVAMGVHGKTGGRSAPTVWNAAFSSVQFWDGRAPSLEEQAKGPVVASVEMGMPKLEAAMDRVRAIPGYAEMFQRAFPGEKNPMTVANTAKAVAAYERTLITPNSAYDRYVKGDKKALTAEQARGMNTFAAVGCTACHAGPAFNGPRLPQGQGFFVNFPAYAGSEYDTKYKLTDDQGRYDVTHQAQDKHTYKVPTLRNVALTAPYFHNGAVKMLDEAVRVMARTQLNKSLTDEQVRDIVAFLNGLTGEFPQQTMPRLPGTPGTTIVD